MFLLVTLVGNPVTVTVKGGNKFFGIFSAANTDGGDLGVALASAQQILSKDGGETELGELKRVLLINAKDLESIEAAEIRVQDQAKEMREAREKEAFRTDTEISKSFDALASGRALQKWSDDPDLPDIGASPAWAGPANGVSGGLESSNGKPWDQFAANEARFGIKSDYQENLYTTSLDKSGKDFRDREREADRLAREIMGQASTNTHIAEERGQADDSGINEEDKYGAVVRSPNAYVPPALRSKQGLPAGPEATVKVRSVPASAKDKTAANADEARANPGATENGPAPPAVNIDAASPALPQDSQSKDPAAANKKAAADAENPLMGDFRQFVSSERERLEKKKAALAKKEKDTRLADLKAWGGSFTLKTPVPADVPGLTSHEKTDVQKSAGPSPQPAGAKAEAVKAPTSKPSSKTASNVPSPSGGAKLAAAELADTKAMLQKMTIPKIPPFNPDKLKARQSGVPTNATPAAPKAEGESALSASTSAFKLSAKASTFKPFNPNAAAFTPGGGAAAAAAAGLNALSPVPAAATSSATLSARSVASTSVSPVPAPATPSNPFYGNQVLKKPAAGSGHLHVREDFNPFKVSKVPDAKSIGPMWAFSGKPYRQHFVLAGPPMDDGSGMFIPGGGMHLGMHPGAQTPQSMPQQVHPGQMPMPGPGNGAQQGQPYGMGYQPYGAGGPYQFYGGQAPPPQGRQPGMPMSQPMQMGPGSVQGGPPMPYGGMPPQYMGQVPFSPAMHQHGAPVPPQNMYSPQMAMPPSASQQHFVPMPPPPQAGPGGGPRPPPPHLQHQGAKGQHPNQPGSGHMYYNQQQHNQAPPPPHTPQQQPPPPQQQPAPQAQPQQAGASPSP